MNLNTKTSLFVVCQCVCGWISPTRLMKTDLTQNILHGADCDPLRPAVPCHHLTAAVRGGANDLCLTNGSFIIPSATSMRPVFIALYFKLNHSSAHPSWSPLTFTGGDGLTKPVCWFRAASASKQTLVNSLCLEPIMICYLCLWWFYYPWFFVRKHL